MKTFFRAASVLALMSAPAFAQTANFYSFADANKDGFISQEELSAVSPAFTSAMFTEFDADNSGDIVIEEISESPLLSGLTFSTPAQFRREAPGIVRRYVTFQSIDRNGDGILTAGEVSAAVPTMTRDRYLQADLNDDGVLDFTELYGSRFLARLADTGAVLMPAEDADEVEMVRDRVRYTRVDRNRDGYISMKELARIAPDATLSEFAAIDTNDDGIIVYRELYDSGLVGEEVMAGVFAVPAKGMKAEVKPATTTTTATKTAAAPGTPSYVLDSYTYAILDTDDDNIMTLAELQAAIPTIKGDELTGIDVDGDGFIRYDEFFRSPTIVRYYDSGAITVPTRTVSIQRSYFTGIDRNRDGLIEEDELMSVSPSANRTVYSSVDTNEDGFVSYDELYGTGWLATAIEEDSILTPAYIYRYYAPRDL